MGWGIQEEASIFFFNVHSYLSMCPKSIMLSVLDLPCLFSLSSHPPHFIARCRTLSSHSSIARCYRMLSRAIVRCRTDRFHPCFDRRIAWLPLQASFTTSSVSGFTEGTSPLSKQEEAIVMETLRYGGQLIDIVWFDVAN